MPLSEFITFCSDCFGRIDRYRIADGVISLAIANYPNNDQLNQALTKVILINSLYGTSIYDTLRIARHIITLDCDQKFRDGDISVVDDIRTGHDITLENGNDRDFYSFATKYASWHSPDHFPIFDNLVKRLLPFLNRDQHFHETFTQVALDNYDTYKAVIDSLMAHCGLENFGYKRFDQGLWVYAKYKYRGDELPDDILEEIENAANGV